MKYLVFIFWGHLSFYFAQETTQSINIVGEPEIIKVNTPIRLKVQNYEQKFFQFKQSDLISNEKYDIKVSYRGEVRIII